ncbi:MAG: hypothetical protein PHE43_01515 [Candidatus Nanoarchaeia archaeon]|nr:hypothetical protein [Candidatus Nanoarchaeia archaeon]
MDHKTCNLDQSENLIFHIDELLKKSIEQKEISPQVIECFDKLAKDFEEMGNVFFNKFDQKMMDQIITFGAAITTKDICLNLKDNLTNAKMAHQNPIAAKRILDRDYLVFIRLIIDSLKNIYDSNKIENECFVTLNDSIRILIKLSKEDAIYKEDRILFSNKEGEEILVKVLNETNELISEL